MQQLIQREKAAHWYALNNNQWEACCDLPKKDGSGMKAVTLREARELLLFPSVTGVMDVLSKPALTAWLQEQSILAALTLPRLPGEPEDAFAKRVVTDMQAQSDTARDFGSRIHDALARRLTGEVKSHLDLGIDADIAPFVRPAFDWVADHVSKTILSETVVGCKEVGFAGRLDLEAEMADGLGPTIIDFKTQRIKGGKPVFYPEWAAQLAAYRRCRNNDLLRCLSVIIDSGTPGPVHVKCWGEAELHIGWETFVRCHWLWCATRGYWPITK